MSEYQKQLTQHQAALAELNKQLPQLRATAREAEQTFSKSRAGKPRFPHELVAPYTNAKAAIDQHNAEINRLRGLVSWEEGVRSASSDIRKAQKEAMRTQGELTKLVEKRTKISSKLEKAQREQRGEIEKLKPLNNVPPTHTQQHWPTATTQPKSVPKRLSSKHRKQ